MILQIHEINISFCRDAAFFLSFNLCNNVNFIEDKQRRSNDT